jgi:hypothetical protein
VCAGDATKWLACNKDIDMTEFQPDTDYPVFVRERNGTYDLRIRELLLVVHGPILRQAYEELIRQKQEIIDSARAFGTLDDLPLPVRPPLVPSASSGLRSFWIKRR